MNRRFSSLLFLSVLVVLVALVTTACGGGAPKQSSETPAPAVAQQAAPPSATPPATPPAEQPPAAAPEKPAVAPAARTPKPAAPRSTGEEAGRAETAPAATTPASAPPAEPLIKTVPAGTAIEVAFLDGVSSKASRAGDSFRTRVTKDVEQDGVVVIPAGSVVLGSVVEAVPLKKIGGQAKLVLDFVKVELTSGRSAPISASFAEQGKSETGKDAATIGGATAGGALLGRILSKNDKGKGTVLGAVVGAAAGTAIASKTKGQEVEIPAGTVIVLNLAQPAQVTVRP